MESARPTNTNVRPDSPHAVSRPLLSAPVVWITLGWLALAVLLLYKPAFGWWWSHWFREGTENYYGHGPLVPLFMAVLIWTRRQQWRQLQPKPHSAGLALTIVALALALVGHRAGSAWVLSLSFPLLIVGALLYFLGRPALKLASWPLAVMLFAIPLPMWLLARMTVPPQLISADLSALSFRLLGFEIEQVGTTIYLSNYALEVAAACSGFRLLISIAAFATFLVALVNAPWWRRALLWALAPVVGIAANVVRILSIGIAGELGSDSLADFMHHTGAQGLVLLAIIFFVLLASLLKCPLSLDESA